MGNALKRNNNFKEAIKAYKKATSLKVNYPVAHNNLGNAYKEEGVLEGAINAYKKAIALQPNYPEAYYNLGNAFKEKGDLEEAIQAYNQAISLQPNYSEAYNNLGTTLKDKGDLEEAIQAYNQAIFLKPNYAEANENLGRLYWLIEEFRKAFQLMEWRKNGEKQKLSNNLSHRKPVWNGVDKNRVFVCKEQGIGDEIMFSSMLSELSNKSEKLIVECDRRLLPIYNRSFSKQINFIDERTQPNERDYDSQVALGSLPTYFRKSLGDFTKVSNGWINADANKVAQFKKKLNTDLGVNVIGLSWFTKSKNEYSADRNIATKLLAEYLALIPAKYVSLQYGNTTDEIRKMRDLFGINVNHIDEVDLFNDLDSFAALISACDLVISIDNVTVHLAGALGVDTRVLLPRLADERWGVNRVNSYWYDSLTIYRQNIRGDWHTPLKRLARDVIEFVG